MKMYRHILRIGNAKYTFNQATLCAFVAEAKMREAAAALDPPSRSASPCDAGDGGLHPVFEEVGEITALYRAYRSSGSIEALVRLKARLEMVSVRYESHALAQEVLSINSCLPYDRRVLCS